MDIGNKIRTSRQTAGMTQCELAEKLHVTPQAVSNWERGERLPGFEMIPALATTLGVSYKELFDEEKFLDFYTAEQKVLLLRKCIDHASVANRLCSMLDRWKQEDLRIREQEDEELQRRGLLDKSRPFRGLKRACDIDPFGTRRRAALKRREELGRFIKENGTIAMRYVLMILYFGEDIEHKVWALPATSDPSYIDSVCDLLLTDQDDYMRLENPYYTVYEKKPELVAGWIRNGLKFMIQAV